MNAILCSDSPTFASLFSGCGGFDIGFLQEGYTCKGAFDIDDDSVAIYKSNIGLHIQVCDLSQPNTNLDHIQDVDVLIAGPPCQGFSTAGKRDPHDPRNKLLFIVASVASKVKPKVVLVENVTGVLAGKHRHHWNELTVSLRNQGYQITQMKCDASSAGVAQKRKRVLLLAWRSSRDITFKLPLDEGGVLHDVLQDIEGLPNHNPQPLAEGSRLSLIARRIAPGQKLSNVRRGSRSVHTWNIPEVYGEVSDWEKILLEALVVLRRRNRVRDYGDADPVTAHALYHHLGRPVADSLHMLVKKGYVRKDGRFYDLTNTFNGKFRRLRWDRPSFTVDTRFGDPRYFLHPEDNRGFTVREAARIQGFPDSYMFAGPERNQYRMIGNAVPPPLSRHLAAFVRDALLR